MKIFYQMWCPNLGFAKMELECYRLSTQIESLLWNSDSWAVRKTHVIGVRGAHTLLHIHTTETVRVIAGNNTFMFARCYQPGWPRLILKKLNRFNTWRKNHRKYHASRMTTKLKKQILQGAAKHIHIVSKKQSEGIYALGRKWALLERDCTHIWNVYPQSKNIIH